MESTETINLNLVPVNLMNIPVRPVHPPVMCKEKHTYPTTPTLNRNSRTLQSKPIRLSSHTQQFSTILSPIVSESDKTFSEYG